MSPLKISWKSLWSKPLSSALNIMLIAFGTGILTILLLASTQIGQKLDNNSKDIDLVVGAKGSPLQLILSSIYYIDFPTGNIPLKAAQELAHSPFVKKAVPLAQGDNYQGIRIVGTDSNFVSIYKLKTSAGKFWSADFEVTIGSIVAANQKLKIGDTFFGAHGLTGSSDIHKTHAYKVVGILTPQGNVTDNLILTNIASVWKMHEDHEKEEAAEHHQDGKGHQHEDGTTHQHDKNQRPDQGPQNEEKEITALLIQYRSPMSVVMFPRMVNQSTNLQAASPAMESTRLFSLIGVGVDTLQWFAALIMLIAAISVFVNLYNSLKERNYDLAIMRTLGASRSQLFCIVIFEGILLTLAGTIIGILLGHLVLQLIGNYQESSQARLSGFIFLKDEIYLFAAGLAIGIFAGIIPALQAYRSNISKILSKN
ncbi:putative ABC transport system permease protein [Pedobacter cryoconitis]|uniref:Putative ABC transport system permease protein n=1 Tax=Pedobacter cryoconitis TaxID=188932 RepID=A0A7W8ZHV8_9SPHI|nr:FtsX-like permease family protein [Pedobacter cryoconitis]MBB5634277.1 putative ABC transport system permease protein [Pedobacter cryoconitis]MBB6272602.1 putative ABC transport system permease protein [Pedobacter cryoconitis]